MPASEADGVEAKGGQTEAERGNLRLREANERGEMGHDAPRSSQLQKLTSWARSPEDWLLEPKKSKFPRKK